MLLGSMKDLFLTFRAPQGENMIPSNHMLLGVLTLGLMLTASAQAAGRKPDGCQILQDRGAVVCMAKVSCRDSATAMAQVRPLFAQCAVGDPLSRRQAEAILSQFKSDLYFQCCIGNALVPTLPGSQTGALHQ